MNYKSKYSLYGVIFSVSVLLVPMQATAEIYKCENIKKEIFYNDKPCPALDKETEMVAVKDPKDGYVFPAIVLDKNNKKQELSINKKSNSTEKSKLDYKKREGLETNGLNEGKNVQDKEGKNGSNVSLTNGLQENERVVSSSGRVSFVSSRRASDDSKTRYIMKVEDNIREPR